MVLEVISQKSIKGNFFITFLNYEQKLLFQLRKILIQNVLYYIYLKGESKF